MWQDSFLLLCFFLSVCYPLKKSLLSYLCSGASAHLLRGPQVPQLDPFWGPRTSSQLRFSRAGPHVSVGTSIPLGIERKLCGLWFLRGTLPGWGRPSLPASRVPHPRSRPTSSRRGLQRGLRTPAVHTVLWEPQRGLCVCVVCSHDFFALLVGNLGEGKRNGCTRASSWPF